jgi:WD40 repeat protein
MAFSPDGTHLAVGRSTAIEIWQVADGSLLHTLDTGRGGTSDVLLYSPDGRYLLSGGLVPNMTLWNTETGEAFAQLTDLGGDRVSAAFSPDGTLLLTSAITGQVALWDMATGDRYDLQVGADRPLFVDWSPDGYVMIFVDAGGSIFVWGVGEEPISE